MNLRLRVEWVRKLKNEEAIRECRWKTPVEWDDVDIHVFSENDLNDLLALMATMPREKAPTQ